MVMQAPEQQVRGQDTTTLKDALEFLRRRLWLCASVAIIISVTAIIVAFRLPPVYLSQATILIEQPAIPEDIVPSTIRSYVDEQIQITATRVYRPESVMQIVEEFDLYPQERKSLSDEAIVEHFVADTSLESLTAEVTDDRGRAADTTFAFVVGFHHGEPEKAQAVASRLAERFLDENLQSRRERASITTTFLEQEAERLAAEIAAMEDRIAEFKAEYGNALPEQKTANVNVLSDTEAELGRLDADLRELRAQESIVRSEMAALSPYTTVYSQSGEPILSAEERLQELRAQYLQYSARYGPQHPDVIRTKREIEAIVGSGNVEGALGDVAQQRATLEAERDQLRERYSAEHPDVVRLQKAIDALPESSGAVQPSTVQRPPNNPAYISAQARLKSIQAGIASAQQRRDQLIARQAELERSMAMAPRVEQEWLQLNRGYNSARLEYEEIKRRATSARLSENLEAENKGERFTLLKRAGLPSIPVEPNRTAIIFLGIVLAIGAGVGLAALIDAMDTTVRSAQDLQTVLAVKPLGTIPYIRTAHDRRMWWTRRVTAAGATIVCIIAVLVLV